MERTSIVRIIKIIACIVFQIFGSIFLFNSAGGMEFWQQAMQHLFEPGAIVLVILILPYLVASTVNIMIIISLVKNKGRKEAS